MNKELDALLCLLDGKITAYRMKNPYDTVNGTSKGNSAYMNLTQIQLEIQKMWDENREV